MAPQADAIEAEAKVMGFGDVPAAAEAPKVAPWAPALACLPDGRYRLSVAWGAEGHLYLLKRTATGVFEVPPIRTPSVTSQRRVTVFEFSFEPGQALDLYLRPQPEPDPTALVPSGDGMGRWQRILPE